MCIGIPLVLLPSTMTEPYWNYLSNRHGALLTSMVGAALATMPRHEGVLRGTEEKKRLVHSILEQVPEQIFESGGSEGSLWSIVATAEGKARMFFDQVAVQITFAVLMKIVHEMQRVLTESCKKRKIGDKEHAVNKVSQPDEQDNPKPPWQEDESMTSPWKRTVGPGNTVSWINEGAASSADSKKGGPNIASLHGDHPQSGEPPKQNVLTPVRYNHRFSDNGTPIRMAVPTETEHYNMDQSAINGESDDSAPHSTLNESDKGTDPVRERRRRQTEETLRDIHHHMSHHEMRIDTLSAQMQAATEKSFDMAVMAKIQSTIEEVATRLTQLESKMEIRENAPPGITITESTHGTPPQEGKRARVHSTRLEEYDLDDFSSKEKNELITKYKNKVLESMKASPLASNAVWITLEKGSLIIRGEIEDVTGAGQWPTEEQAREMVQTVVNQRTTRTDNAVTNAAQTETRRPFLEAAAQEQAGTSGRRPKVLAHMKNASDWSQRRT